jgi:hypothetical protein
MPRRCRLLDLGDRVLELVREGEPRAAVVDRVGISRRCLVEWLQRGRRGESPYAAFAHELDRLEAVRRHEARERRRLQSWRRLQGHRDRRQFHGDRAMRLLEQLPAPHDDVCLVAGVGAWDGWEELILDRCCPTCGCRPAPGRVCLRCGRGDVLDA